MGGSEQRCARRGRRSRPSRLRHRVRRTARSRSRRAGRGRFPGHAARTVLARRLGVTQRLQPPVHVWASAGSSSTGARGLPVALDGTPPRRRASLAAPRPRAPGRRRRTRVVPCPGFAVDERPRPGAAFMRACTIGARARAVPARLHRRGAQLEDHSSAHRLRPCRIPASRTTRAAIIPRAAPDATAAAWSRRMLRLRRKRRARRRTGIPGRVCPKVREDVVSRGRIRPHPR